MFGSGYPAASQFKLISTPISTIVLAERNSITGGATIWKLKIEESYWLHKQYQECLTY